MRRSRFIFAATVALAALACLPAWRPHQAELRFDGEYGLWVSRSADTLRVAWFTAARAPGSLQVLDGSRTVHQARTPADTVHSVTFTHRGGGNLVLRYGAEGSTTDRHETTIRLDAAQRRPRVTQSGVDSIFVISDIHGEFDTMTAVLRNARIIDARNQWSAGRAHLVVAGDIMDRGKDVVRALWFLYALEAQAERAGGRVDIVAGNHEIMVMTGDLRYLHPKDQAIAARYGVSYSELFHPRSSILGSWLASKPALIRIDDVLIAHGGVSTDYLGMTLESYDDSLAAFVNEELFARWSDTTYTPPLDSAGFARRDQFFWQPNSVFWYREYAQTDTLTNALAAVLSHFRARIHVIGHTPGPTIRERYAGSLIAVNTLPFGREVLLLVRHRAGGYDRWRFRTTGAPERLESDPSER